MYTHIYTERTRRRRIWRRSAPPAQESEGGAVVVEAVGAGAAVEAVAVGGVVGVVEVGVVVGVASRCLL